MSIALADPVVAALRAPDALASASIGQWSQLVRDARRADLLARIAHDMRRLGLITQVPEQPRAHLLAEERLAQAQLRDVAREVAHVGAALAPLDVKVVLLKGAAYAVAGAAAARGRLFADVDVLVPQDRLNEVEAALLARGWITTHQDAYDQRYYREWMHELPPMENIHRNTVLDVHHAILPRTARAKPNSCDVLDAAVPMPHLGPGIHVPSIHDMILHSMAHLFHNEEMSHGLRDLSDIDLMLRAAQVEAGFWHRLQQRAVQLDLNECLHLGLQHVHAILGSPVPEDIVEASVRHGRSSMSGRLMQGAWARALSTPPAPDRSAWRTRLALSAVYLRAHWQRMPPTLLVRHLAIKGARRLRGDAKPTQTDA